MTTPTPELTTITERLNAVRGEVTAACARANRPADSVTLVAVSKTHPARTVLDAIAGGQTHFGENRVEEAADKIAAVRKALPDSSRSGLTWHMIGHVQSRKARDVIADFDLIHSLDSLKLAERYGRFAVEMHKVIPVLLEMNVSGEESKSGFDASGWQHNPDKRQSLWNDIQRIIEVQGVRVSGLMTVAPLVDDPEKARPTFTALRTLRDALAADFPAAKWDTLSMGMSDDFDIAIQEGATIVRIGRAIFGQRG